jgi:hypothetical protein
MVAKKHVFFINKKNSWSYFFCEINFKTKNKKKEKNFLKKILYWLTRKILFKLNILFIFWIKKKNRYKSYENLIEKGKNYRAEKFLTNFNSKIAYQFMKFLGEKKEKYSKKYIHKKKFCRKKLIFWEIIRKFKNIYPVYNFFFDQYVESTLEKYQSLEFLSPSIFCSGIMNKNFVFEKIFKFTRIFVSHFLSNYSYECFPPQYFNEFSRDILIFLTRIFRKPNSKQKKKFMKKNIQRDEIFLFFLDRKNFWYELLKNSISVKNGTMKIFPSFRHGWGVYCKENIPTMTILAEYRGDSKRILDLNQIEIFYRFLEKDLFLFKLNEQKTIDATFQGNLGRLINHSCNPNCFSKKINHAGKNYILIINHKPLKNLEEIDYDYRINSDDHDSEQILCDCNTFFCKRNLCL